MLVLNIYFLQLPFLHGQIQEVNWSAALVVLYEQSNRLSIGNDGSVLVGGYFQDNLLVYRQEV